MRPERIDQQMMTFASQRLDRAANALAHVLDAWPVVAKADALDRKVATKRH